MLCSMLSYIIFQLSFEQIPHNEDDHFSMTANNQYTTLLRTYSLKTTHWEIKKESFGGTSEG